MSAKCQSCDARSRCLQWDEKALWKHLVWGTISIKYPLEIQSLWSRTCIDCIQFQNHLTTTHNNKYIQQQVYKDTCNVSLSSLIKYPNSVLHSLATLTLFLHTYHLPSTPPDFTTFIPASESEISKILFNCPNKQCDSDPIPTWLVISCASVLIPTITNIVNLSLSSGQFHPILKEAVISPSSRNLLWTITNSRIITPFQIFLSYLK